MANTTSPKNQSQNQTQNQKTRESEDLLDTPDALARQEVKTLPKGTVIHIKGQSVELGEDAQISTKAETWRGVKEVLPDFDAAQEKANGKQAK